MSKSSLDKYDSFIMKFQTQMQIEKEVLRIYEEEYDEIFENILIKSQSIFMKNLDKRIKSMLEELYTPKILENEKVLIAIKSVEKIIYQDYYLYDKEKLSKILHYKGKDFIENGQNFSFLKHCIYQNNEPLHFCNQKNNFIIVLDKNLKVDFNGIKNIHRKGSSSEYNIIYAIICRNCLKSYKANYINLFCNFCSIPYYTRIISLNEIYNNSIQPATWDKYHCHLIVNQQMNCIKCKSPLFLNIKNGKLICKNCNFCDDPYNINWTCIKCGNEFNCGAKIYNPYEFKPFSNAIKKGINEKKSALPKKIPCGHDVKLIVHNKNCDGKLYLTDLNDTEMVLCSKCKSLIKYEKFIFECPKCGKRFRNKDIEDYFNKGRIINDENLDYNNLVKNIINIFYIGEKKLPQLVKGSNVGYDLSELKNTPTSELKNILKTIYLYFTMKTRQKTQNVNFKNLYLRVKEELREREIFKKYKKIKLPVFNLNKPLTPIEQIDIPDFLNDKKNRIIEKTHKNSISTNFSSTSISDKSFEEDNLKEQIELLKNERIILYEMLNRKNKYNNSSNEIKEEEKFDFNFFSKFNMNKVPDFNLNMERNLLVIHSENNSVCNDKIDKEKLFEEQKFSFQKI